MKKVYFVKPYINLTTPVLGTVNDECDVYLLNHSMSTMEHSLGTAALGDAWPEHSGS